jgi:hypothetical protein
VYVFSVIQMCVLVDLSSSIFCGFVSVCVREIEKKVQYSAREAVLGCLGKGLDVFYFS